MKLCFRICFCLFLFNISCSDETSIDTGVPTSDETVTEDKSKTTEELSSSFDSTSDTSDTTGATSDSGGGSSSSGSSSGEQAQEGLITAGEWNDLDNWSLWDTFLQTDDFSKLPEYWELYTNNRFKVKVLNNDKAVVNATVNLLENNTVVWSSKTDVFGHAELWLNPFEYNPISDLTNYSIQINGSETISNPKLIKEGINEINIQTAEAISQKIEIAFIVDATGSMSDEIDFLKADLKGVIQSIETSKPNSDVYTGTVFYRDTEDEYLYKYSEFTNNIETTVNFINQQNASGGGDFPEAVEVALEKTLSELQWSENAYSKLAFLLLDAPPHYTPLIIEKLQTYIKEFSKKGIKIIPITASGIDKKTEFLMRHFSMFTNGTYVFITNDSGIGGNHIEATVGDYEVEILKDLIIRLINKYTQE